MNQATFNDRLLTEVSNISSHEISLKHLNQEGNRAIPLINNEKITDTGKTNDKNGNKRESVFLYCCVICTVLVSFSGGITISWTSPVFPKLDTEENPFGHPISTSQKAWIAALPYLGAAIGPLIAGSSAERFGRKKVLLGIAVPMFLGYIILAASSNIELWYFARFIQGLSKGSGVTIVSIYISEITQPFNRGKFCSCIGFSVSVGILYPFSVGPHLNIQWYALTCAIPSFVFFLLFSIFMPESPYFLVLNDDGSSAHLALKKLRPKEFNICEELSDIRYFQRFHQKSSWKQVFRTEHSRRCFLISVGLLYFQQFSGLFAIFAYMKTIFESTGSTIHPNVCTLIIGAVESSSHILCISLVEKINRKTLLMTSLSGCSVSLCSLGTYFFLKEHNFDVSSVFWLPVTSLIIYNIFFSLSLGPVVMAVVAEIFSSDTKAWASAISVTFSFIFSGSVSILFPFISEFVGMFCVFWVFSINCIFGIIFVYFLLPETRGKTLAEIQDIFKAAVQ